MTTTEFLSMSAAATYQQFGVLPLTWKYEFDTKGTKLDLTSMGQNEQMGTQNKLIDTVAQVVSELKPTDAVTAHDITKLVREAVNNTSGEFALDKLNKRKKTDPTYNVKHDSVNVCLRRLAMQGLVRRQYDMIANRYQYSGMQSAQSNSPVVDLGAVAVEKIRNYVENFRSRYNHNPTIENVLDSVHSLVKGLNSNEIYTIIKGGCVPGVKVVDDSVRFSTGDVIMKYVVVGK